MEATEELKGQVCGKEEVAGIPAVQVGKISVRRKQGVQD